MDQSDKQLFIHLKNGSTQAFEKLYASHKENAVHFCTSLLKDYDEAENLVHDVFVQLWEKRAKLSIDTSFKAYLFTCIKNKAFDHFKNIRRSEDAIESLWYLIDKIQNEKEDLENDFNIESLIHAIDSLPEGRKEILHLRYFKGKSYQEIAEQLNISCNTVKNQLIKAKQYLRNNIDISATCSIILLYSFCFLIM